MGFNKEAFNILFEGLVSLGQLPDPNVTGPNVVIEPIEPLVQKAVDILKKMDGNYFSGVKKIKVNPSTSNFGFVESGPDKDPTIININLSRIKGLESEIDVLFQLILTIAHESAHAKSFKDGVFIGGETPAENEERRVAGWLNQNSNVLSDAIKTADVSSLSYIFKKLAGEDVWSDNKMTIHKANDINFKLSGTNGLDSLNRILLNFNLRVGKRIDKNRRFIEDYFGKTIKNCCLIETTDKQYQVIPFKVEEK